MTCFRSALDDEKAEDREKSIAACTERLFARAASAQSPARSKMCEGMCRAWQACAT